MGVKVGDEVLYHPYPGYPINNPTGETKFAAHVAAIWNDQLVNLQVIDGMGNTQSRTSVYYWDGNGNNPGDGSAFCAPHSAFETADSSLAGATAS